MLYGNGVYDEKLYGGEPPVYDQYVSRVDIVSVGITEVAAVAVVISVTEAVNIAIADAYISALALIAVYDHIDVSALELLSAIESALSRIDDIDVAIIDAGSLQVAENVTDDIDVAVADGSAMLKVSRLVPTPYALRIDWSRRQ